MRAWFPADSRSWEPRIFYKPNAMKLNKIDTSKFLYDPRDSNSYIKLRDFKEFKKSFPPKLPWEKVVQYIILMYDQASDVVRAEWPLYPQRKREVARMVGLEVSGKNKYIEDMLIGLNSEINDMIIRYLRLFNSPELTMLASYQEISVRLQKQALTGNIDKNLITNIDLVATTIRDLEERVFRGKDETQLRAELYRTMEDEQLGIMSEQIAEKLSRGEDPVRGINPYGDGYVPDKLHFIGDK